MDGRGAIRRRRRYGCKGGGRIQNSTQRFLQLLSSEDESHSKFKRTRIKRERGKNLNMFFCFLFTIRKQMGHTTLVSLIRLDRVDDPSLPNCVLHKSPRYLPFDDVAPSQTHSKKSGRLSVMSSARLGHEMSTAIIMSSGVEAVGILMQPYIGSCLGPVWCPLSHDNEVMVHRVTSREIYVCLKWCQSLMT
jgi:hypothetical protein